jgi:hypothetical protein
VGAVAERTSFEPASDSIQTRCSHRMRPPPRHESWSVFLAVVIRIDSLQQGSAVVVRVAGSVAGPDVTVLCDLVARDGLPDEIDLSEVGFVDAEGASALLGLEARGAALVGAEPFIELLIRAGQGSNPP